MVHTETNFMTLLNHNKNFKKLQDRTGGASFGGNDEEDNGFNSHLKPPQIQKPENHKLLLYKHSSGAGGGSVNDDFDDLSNGGHPMNIFEDSAQTNQMVLPFEVLIE